jgi:hypothetical protein
MGDSSMRKAALCLAAAIALPGCPSADDVAREPVRWSATYATGWEDMANCLARSASRDFRVTPLINQRQRAAEIVLAHREAEAVMYIFEVKGLDGGRAEVALKRSKQIADIEGWGARHRANAERCGGRV